MERFLFRKVEMWIVGLLIVPRLLRYIGKFKNDETLLIASLGFLGSFGHCIVGLGTCMVCRGRHCLGSHCVYGSVYLER